MESKKAPHPTDILMGARIRTARVQKGWSQEKLGDAIGVTFQQVQKYEKGKNRVGASRIRMIADALDVSVVWMMEAIQGDDSAGPSADQIAMATFGTLPEAQAVAKAMLAMPARARHVVVEVAAALAR